MKLLQLTERRRYLETERQTKERKEALEVAQGTAETIALRQARGEEIHTPQAGRGERAKPAYVLKGIDYLAKQKRLTTQQYQAAERYGRLYRILETGDVKSCLDVLEIRGSTGLGPTDVKVWARYKLREARDELNGHAGMIAALDMICGEDMKPSEVTKDRRGYERLESQLDCALTILVKLWGM